MPERIVDKTADAVESLRVDPTSFAPGGLKSWAFLVGPILVL
jgi:hypothetical protein